jgi:hypothetical protein
VTDLSALPPRPQVEAPVRRVDDGGQSRWLKGLLNGSWKVALLLVGGYALFRLARYARDRFQQRFSAARGRQAGGAPHSLAHGNAICVLVRPSRIGR